MTAAFGEDGPGLFDPIPSPFTEQERRPAFGADAPDDVTPLFDPATGEVLDGPVTAADEPGDPTTAADPGTDVLDPVAHADGVVLDLGPHDDLAAFTRDLRQQVLGRIDDGYVALLAARDATQPIEVAVRPEVRWLAATHDTLAAVGRVFADAATATKQIAGDVVQEARPERDLTRHGGSVSLRVPVAQQSPDDVKVTATRPTEAFADLDAILDVLVAGLLEDVGAAEVSGDEVEAYARGARDALTEARDVTSPWKVKTSALDVLGRRLPEALAARLTAAYGRRPVDREPTVTFEHVEGKA